MAISVFFGGLGKIPSDGIPYPVFCYCGMLPWTYFSNSLSRGSASIVGNAHLISKIYFPRLIIPASMMVQPLIDFAISFGALICVMLYFHMTPPATAFVYIPLLTLLASALALAISLWLGALNVYYRDIAHIVPFLTQLWMFSSPIVFPYSLIPAKYQQIAALNPIVGLVEGFRSALLGRPWMVEPLLTSVGITLVLLASGAFFFRRLESDFADVA
ncbi:MAG: ABC transporter permease [Deltaproteobacteria bacterium]|nr:ABC transporter permease [Deltaproteobacteria bacterium]